MQAVRIHTYGPAANLVIDDIPVPIAGPDERLVRVTAAAINPFDLAFRQGFMSEIRPTTLPATLGIDFAGIVASDGSGMAGKFAPGTKVNGAIGTGAQAEFIVVPTATLAVIPDDLEDAVAAALPAVGLTAWQGVERIKAAGARTVLIHGAGGNVGRLAVQFAIRHGLDVIATASARDIETLTGLGAGQVIDYRTKRFEDQIDGVDAVLDFAPGDTLDRSYAVVRPGGTLVTSINRPDPERAGRHGVSVSWLEMKVDAGQLAELNRLVASGQVVPKPVEQRPLAEVREAHEALEQGLTHAKQVLTMG